MPRYSYTAKSLSGETKSGALDSKDIRQLAVSLRQEGLILVRAELEQEKAPGQSLGLGNFFGPSLTEKMFFTRNLQVMVSSGLSLPRAMEALASQTKNKKFQKALLGVKEAITKGKSFSDALASYPGIFSNLFQNMVRAGEESGNLEEVLKTLALQMEREADLKSKIKSAMIYPSVIVVAMIGVGILMLIMVVPKLTAAFKDLNVELPLTTKLVIGFADFLLHKWYFAAAIFLAISFSLWRILKSGVGKRIFSAFLLRLPAISQLVKNSNTAQVTRTLSSLIAAGVALPKSLEITAKTLSNSYYREALSDAQERVRKGETLSGIFKSYQKIFPPTFIQMVGIGEETGETSSILQKIAEFYETEVSNAARNLSSVVEPVLMIIIGAVVGFFAISMIQPMYSMLGAIE